MRRLPANERVKVAQHKRFIEFKFGAIIEWRSYKNV